MRNSSLVAILLVLLAAAHAGAAGGYQRSTGFHFGTPRVATTPTASRTRKPSPLTGLIRKSMKKVGVALFGHKSH